MSKIEKLFQQQTAQTTTNYAGAPAFVRSEEERLVQSLMTGTFQDTFYADAQTLADEAILLYLDFAQKDPAFLARATLYARTAGSMRSAPIVALVALSTGGTEAKQLAHLVAPHILKTPGDVQDLVKLCHPKAIRGMGQSMQRIIQDWLNRMSEYHAIKYGAESQDMALRDILRLARPTPKDETQDALFRYIVKGEVNPALLPQIAGYEAFKRAAAENEIATALSLVSEHQLPWEVVTGQLPRSREAWRAMSEQMPYFALIRNLANMIRNGVFDDAEYLEQVCAIIRNPQRVAHSHMLPFQLYSAVKRLADVVSPVTHTVAVAVNTAIELSFANMPEIDGHILLANDVSGSMSWNVSEKSKMTCNEIAALFAIAVAKKSKGADIVSFDTQLYQHDLNMSLPLAVLTEKISGAGGGTDLSLPVKFASTQPRPYRAVVAFTDSESWMDYVKKTPAINAIRELHGRHGTQFFFVQIMPYAHAVAPQAEPGCHYLYGWSANTVSYIAHVLGDRQSQISTIRGLQLPE